MKTGLVLSGGGSRGAFQVGAITALQEAGFTFDLVSGVSVGALNGSMVAQGKFDEMRKVWEVITSDRVHKKPWWPVIIWNNLFGGKKSLYDLRPLMERLKENVKKEDFKIPFYMGIVSLRTGDYHTVSDQDCEDTRTICDGIYASSLMPILWEPIDVTLKDKVIKDAVDGGVKNVIPLKDILGKGVDRIVIIACNNAQTAEAEQHNIIEVAERTFLDIMLNEVVANDIKGILHTNRLIKQAEKGGVTLFSDTGRAYKPFEVILIQPEFKLGASTDFSRDKLLDYHKQGYDRAKLALQNPL